MKISGLEKLKEAWRRKKKLEAEEKQYWEDIKAGKKTAFEHSPKAEIDIQRQAERLRVESARLESEKEITSRKQMEELKREQARLGYSSEIDSKIKTWMNQGIPVGEMVSRLKSESAKRKFEEAHPTVMRKVYSPWRGVEDIQVPLSQVQEQEMARELEVEALKEEMGMLKEIRQARKRERVLAPVKAVAKAAVAATGAAAGGLGGLKVSTRLYESTPALRQVSAPGRIMLPSISPLPVAPTARQRGPARIPVIPLGGPQGDLSHLRDLLIPGPIGKTQPKRTGTNSYEEQLRRIRKLLI